MIVAANNTLHFVVETDVSDVGYSSHSNSQWMPSSILSQEPHKPLGTSPNEACAIAQAIRRWRYLDLYSLQTKNTYHSCSTFHTKARLKTTKFNHGESNFQASVLTYGVVKQKTWHQTLCPVWAASRLSPPLTYRNFIVPCAILISPDCSILSIEVTCRSLEGKLKEQSLTVGYAWKWNSL